MPRPERIRLRAGQAVAAEEHDETPANEVVAAPEKAALDGKEEQGQSSAPGPVQDADFMEALAKRLGHQPKEAWTRDPEKWVDARAFLERTPDELSTLRERLRRTAQVAEQQANEAAATAKEEAIRELRAAAANGDEDAAAKAEQKLRNAQPHPATVAWMAKNPWFRADEAARNVAAVAIRQAEQRGAGVEEALEAGEAEAKRRFPEFFSDTPAPRAETRLSEARSIPQVQGGSRGNGTGAAKREKGWGDIPSGDRNEMSKAFMKRLTQRGLTEAQVQSKLATQYWANQA